MEDIYRRHINMQAVDRLLLRVARWTTLAAGVAAAVCAFYFDNIILALEFIYDFWAPGMIVPFLVGVFWYREERIHAVVASMAAGTAATIVWRFILGSPWQLSPALFGFAVAVAVLFLSLPLTRGIRPGHLFQPRDASYHGK